MESLNRDPTVDSEFANEFAEIESTHDQRAKAQLYSELLSKIINKPSNSLARDLTLFFGAIFGSEISVIATRPLLDRFISSLKPLPANIRIQVGLPAITVLQTRATSVEEQDALLRETLADAYEEVEEYSDAARVLQGIHLDSSQRHISDEEKIRMWIRIIRLYLEDDDAGGAEMFLHKIKNLPTKTEDPALQLHFQLSQARILDARRRFLEASQEYFAVSLASGVDEEDRLQALSAAIRCVVLAPAGPQRSRALSRLYKDDRSSSLEEYSILEKIFRDQLLTEDEVSNFASGLVPHQLAQTADGLTVLDKAVIEHNLLAASRLYENIRVDDLGLILGLKASGEMTAGEKAEAYAARMLEQGRLKGSIDQIEGVISFNSEIYGDGRTGRSLRYWDAGVQHLAQDVENVAAAIMDEFPEFSTTQMVH